MDALRDKLKFAALPWAAAVFFAASAMRLLGQPSIQNVSPVNVTPSGFSLLWTVSPGVSQSVSVFADPNGVTNLAGQVGIEWYPLDTGDPILTDSSDGRLESDALRALTANLGIAQVRVSSCLPATTYYYRITAMDTNGNQTNWPASGPLPSITTPSENAFVPDAHALLLNVLGTNAQGCVVTLSNTASATVLSAVVGDGAVTNQAYFAIADLTALSGNTNFAPSGSQNFTATIYGLGEPFSQTYTLNFSAAFSGDHFDQFSLLAPSSGAPQVTCPDSIITNAAPCDDEQLVAFVPAATGTPAPLITCQFQGRTITSPFLFPLGTNIVECSASNSSGISTCQFTVTVLSAPPPMPPRVQLGDVENSPANFPVAKLLAQSHDPNGLSLSVSSVDPASAEGGSVSLASGLIEYSPPAGFVGQDQITYTLTDGCVSTQALISVSVSSALAGGGNNLSIVVIGTLRELRFSGVPGQSYIIQWTAALGSPWTNLTSPIQAGTNGLIEYDDTTTPMPPQRFYRTTISP